MTDYTDFCGEFFSFGEIPNKKRTEIVWEAVQQLKDFSLSELIERLRTTTGFRFPTRQSRDGVSYIIQKIKSDGRLKSYGHGSSNTRHKLAE